MGYACPVCDDLQADAEHLANHLAFTAMLHGDEHVDFLDARVPDWEDRRPPDLAAEVIHHAEYVEHDAALDDTAGGAGTGHGGDEADRDAGTPGRPDAEADAVDLEALADGTLDEESRRVVDEARKLFSRGAEPDEDED